LAKRKSVNKQVYQPPDRDHHEQADDAVNHHILSLFSFGLVARAGDEFKHSVQKHHHSRAEQKRNNGIKNAYGASYKTGESGHKFLLRQGRASGRTAS